MKKQSLMRLKAIIIGGSLLIAGPMAFSADYVEVKIELNDGKVTPNTFEVPAKTLVVLNVTNAGKTPAEFESKSLRKEVVLAPGTSSKLVLKQLDAGEYEFYDDFHPTDQKSVMIAK